MYFQIRNCNITKYLVAKLKKGLYVKRVIIMSTFLKCIHNFLKVRTLTLAFFLFCLPVRLLFNTEVHD